jgi:anaerobic magnesium-protoporphyrin IX monomethyl ester cyclase
VAIADLVLAQDDVLGTVRRLIARRRPAVVGLSVMTFQRRTALRLAGRIKTLDPAIRIVAGGYDPSLAEEAYEDAESPIDFVVRGEGEATFRQLLRALERGSGFEGIAGLSWRCGESFIRNAPRHPHRIEDGEVALPDRGARALSGYTILGRPVDVVETSRGCTFDCSFCSIIEFRGRNFHRYPITRVLDDIRDARARGARAIFLVDDNITLDAQRFEDLCRAIVAERLDDVDYAVQAMTSAIAASGARLAPLMRRAGFRYVFLGIENVLDDDLAFLRASAKNRLRGNGGRRGNATLEAIGHLHGNGLHVVGGLIVGNPGDTLESIEANLGFASRFVDWPYIQHPTPYPRTPMAEDFRRRGLIENDRLWEWDGTTAVVRSDHLDAEEIEFRRWRAERWMKARYFPKVARHDPLFALTHARAMFAHLFRGATLRTFLRLEDERAAFERFREIRRRERDLLLPDESPREDPVDEARRDAAHDGEELPLRREHDFFPAAPGHSHDGAGDRL